MPPRFACRSNGWEAAGLRLLALYVFVLSLSLSFSLAPTLSRLRMSVRNGTVSGWMGQGHMTVIRTYLCMYLIQMPHPCTNDASTEMSAYVGT